MQIVFLLEQVVNGLVLGGYYLLLALGLSLIFSVGVSGCDTSVKAAAVLPRSRLWLSIV